MHHEEVWQVAQDLAYFCICKLPAEAIPKLLVRHGMLEIDGFGMVAQSVEYVSDVVDH